MGFWSDLFDAGAQEVKNEANKRASQSGASAHIAAQNETEKEFGAILAAYHNKQISNSTAQAQISKADAAFTAFCQQLSYRRALQGASDIHTLEMKIISDLKAESVSGVIGSLTGATAGVLSGAANLDTGTLALIALWAYALYSRKF